MSGGPLALIRKRLGCGLESLLRWRARTSVKRLLASHHPAVFPAGKALHETLDHHLSDDEAAWVNAIEARRETLSRLDTRVEFTDYGAGRPGEIRDADAMNAGVTNSRMISEICRASKSPFWALLLFKLLREYKPENCIEMGTCLGISAAYQAAALQLNGVGKLVTLEGANALAEIARENLSRFGLRNVEVVQGRFLDTLGDVIMQGGIDYVFIDGHHDEEATRTYFRQLLPHLASEALLVFDDISLYSGLRRAWNDIAEDEAVRFSLDLGALGICVVAARNVPKQAFRIRLV